MEFIILNSDIKCLLCYCSEFLCRLYVIIKVSNTGKDNKEVCFRNSIKTKTLFQYIAKLILEFCNYNKDFNLTLRTKEEI